MPIAAEGWPHILIPMVLGGILVFFGFHVFGVLFVLLGAFSAFFFRDPERAVPTEPGLVLSPADGRIVRVASASEDLAGEGATQVSIFLSIFNVHVNRSPVAGRVVRVDYHEGQFLPAFEDKASIRNEQNVVTLECGERRVAFKQIAGLIARRIVFRKRLSDEVARGERVGLIKFGSRVDVFLPQGVRVVAKVGDRVCGGTSVIGEGL